MQKEYLEKKSDIKSRLESFKNLSKDEMFKEFLFCLLTPQSNAQKCWEAVEEIYKIKNPKYFQINSILKSKTRFHNTKSKRVIKAYSQWKDIFPLLLNKNPKEIRNILAEKVDGYGLKEASHFLRNVGKSNNQIAILDRHILKNLQNNKIIKEIKIKNKKHYLKIEKSFLDYSNSINIPLDELDLLWWSKENGEIFK